MLHTGLPDPEKNLLPQDGVLRYRPDFLSPDEARFFLESLERSIKWDQPSLRLYGKEFPIPRKAAWYGDPDTTYKYSGILNTPLPWTKELLILKEKVESATQSSFNSVLLNFYRDGSDHMSWHADDEKSLGKNPIIASVSLGAIRRFGVKHRYDKTLSPFTLELGSGSLLVMKGEMQEFWHHRIHPTKKPLSSRINLTFRKVIS